MTLERVQRLVAIAAFSASVLLAGLLTLHTFTDFDVFWHVRTGQWILEERQIPRTDPFGEMTRSLPWLDVAWGAQVAAAAIARVAGLFGVQMLAVAIVTLTLASIARRVLHAPLALACALLFVLTAWQRFLVRPDLVAGPLTIVALALIDRLPREPRTASVAIGVLAGLWANVHGSFALVPILVASAAAGALAARAGASVLRWYAVALSAALLGALGNPYGYRIYAVFAPYLRFLLAAFGVLAPGERSDVSEWRPVWRAIAVDPTFPAVPFLLLVLTLAVSLVRDAVLARRSGGGPEAPALAARAACAIVLLGFALSAVRHLLPFAAAALWVVSRGEPASGPFRREPGDAPSHPGAPARRGAPAHQGAAARREWMRRMRPGPLSRLGVATGVLIAAVYFARAVLTDALYVRLDVPQRTGAGPDPDLLPEGAVRWLAAHRPAGRLFNNYDSGAYLLYRLFPDVRTYLDSRLDVTPLHRRVNRALQDPNAFEDLVQQDGIGTIVLLHPSPESLSLLPALAHDPRWILAFRDANTTIHVRSDLGAPPARDPPLTLPPAVEPAAARLNAWLGTFKTRTLPAAELTDAFVSEILGDRQREYAAYQRALARAPDDARARRFFAK